ncbi:hypothetical protein DFA_03584 [Cavenderia fasciculata]|uniref:Uncharacterized protein n=1 Tax=Cavenderia fasciculata TaxID=261658 RepID=F4PI52_CACFS|nr:uncharacterized protein DFA_03584 [Cavenderia fasciculata]EGG25335.1 hypothetical protein DFA_03584 [Cavenderia fasciculata]|eukprot:XP_004363186.1 hypothetical protein DFA_03584 [Cavenderia fasciculata]
MVKRKDKDTTTKTTDAIPTTSSSSSSTADTTATTTNKEKNGVLSAKKMRGYKRMFQAFANDDIETNQKLSETWDLYQRYGQQEIGDISNPSLEYLNEIQKGVSFKLVERYKSKYQKNQKVTSTIDHKMRQVYDSEQLVGGDNNNNNTNQTTNKKRKSRNDNESDDEDEEEEEEEEVQSDDSQEDESEQEYRSSSSSSDEDSSDDDEEDRNSRKTTISTTNNNNNNNDNSQLIPTIDEYVERERYNRYPLSRVSLYSRNVERKCGPEILMALVGHKKFYQSSRWKKREAMKRKEEGEEETKKKRKYL